MIKAYFKKLKDKKAKKEQLAKTKQYYEILRSGASFLKFIKEDLEKQKKNQLNRTQRRRIEKQLAQKGEINQEIVEFYSKRVKEILEFIKKEQEKWWIQNIF